MTSRVTSGALVGLACEPVIVECDAGTGQFSCVIVGLPDAAVQESRERVRAAIKNSGFVFPRGRVTVNLAPADLKKEGPAYDLPIALAILLSDRDSARAATADCVCAGELSLEGDVRAVPGVVSLAAMAKSRGYSSIMVPAGNAPEAALITGLTVYPVTRLRDALVHVLGEEILEPYVASQSDVDAESSHENATHDFAYIRGQRSVKRALEIAAAGGHNVMLYGTPGSGKTLLARSFPTILPELTCDEALEVTSIYSAAGLLSSENGTHRRLAVRPFRSPHHTTSRVALVGGGSSIRPGEITLAHRGVLFLDEFPEYPRSVLEALRQPLEDGIVTVSRASGTVQYPARFTLVAAQNPCPCGYYGSVDKQCICSTNQILSYQKRVSGPLLDRIDLFVEVVRLPLSDLSSAGDEEASFAIRARVSASRALQTARYADTQCATNAEIPSHGIEARCRISREAQSLLRTASEKMNLTPRSYFRVMKVARTIADLADSESVASDHIAEALQYRKKHETAFIG